MPVTLVRYWASHFKSLRHARRIAAYFDECARQGWRCVLVCSRPAAEPAWEAPLNDLGVELVHLPRATGNFDPTCIAGAFDLCRTVGADVFHCDNTHTSPLVGAWLARVPVRLWSKRAMEPAFEEGRAPTLRDRLAISLRLSCRLATRTLPVSEMVADELVRKGIGRARIQVLRSAVEPGEHAPMPRDAAREALGYRPDDIVVVAVGRADPVKGWDVLLRAFLAARARLPRLQLLLAGSTGAPGEQAFKATLDRYLDFHCLTTAVRFTGHRPVISDVLGAADIFVLPSQSEGHSLALVEGLRAALPCIASAVGGAPEIIRHGENGLLFARGDAAALAEAIATIGSDQSARTRLGIAARAVSMPTPEQHARALYELYTSLLTRTSRPHLPGAGAPVSPSSMP